MKTLSTFLLLFLLILPCAIQAQENAFSGEYSSPVITFAIVAYDFNETLDFYTQILGMQKVDEFSIDEAFGKRSGLSNGVPFDVTVLRLTDDPNSSQIKITSFENPDELTKSEFIQDKLGVQYLTILVKSMKPFIDRIDEYGIEYRGETPTPLGNGRQFVLIQDPNGLFIELIGPE